MNVRFLGHACFELSDGDTTVLVDPFLSGNPKAAISADDAAASVILLTHGHGDHIGDTVANRQAHGRAGRGHRRAGQRARRGGT
jgi:L-ascorbate metabolism protein UlaG (beta-lactamase superfamily)